jgi:7-keto-8-aminopelargonate synthetase-like enzyme
VILCGRATREKIIAGSRMFAGNTPLPLPLANAALTSIGLLRSDQSFRCRLSQNVHYVKNALRAVGMTAPENSVPIVAIVPRDRRNAQALRQRLLSRDVFPSLIKYPGAPEGGCFRFVISSEHSREQLDNLIASLTDR